MQTLAETDIEAIYQLYARVSHTLDFADVEGFLGCFTDDAVLDSCQPEEGLSGVHAGQAALRRYAVRDAELSGGGLRRSSLNLLVEPDRTGAKATSTLMVTQAYDDDTDPFGRPSDATRSVLVSGGMFFDTLTRADGQWRFASRTFRNDATQTVMARLHAPLVVGPAEGDQVHG